MIHNQVIHELIKDNKEIIVKLAIILADDDIMNKYSINKVIDLINLSTNLVSRIDSLEQLLIE